MLKKITLSVLLAGPFIIGSGCGTNAHYVEVGDKDQIVSLGQINIQDYANAANATVIDLLQSGVLDKVDHLPAVLFVSLIIDNTSQIVDSDLLTKRMTKVLLDSGKVRITTTDPAAKGFHQEHDFLNDQQDTKLPDFTLSGKIIETIERAGNTRRSTFTFQLSLNDIKTGNQVWQGQKDIGKQGTRPSVGF